ncbi:MAG: DUF1207 domain-containing protein [Gemmatimonadota bacterium]
MTVRIMRAAFGAVLCAAAAAEVRAQVPDGGAFLPESRYFRTPAADPHGPRIAVALLSTNLLETEGRERPAFTLPDPDDSAHDVVAAVSLGVIFPLVQLAEWEDGGAMLVLDGRVFSRFRIEYESRDDMGQDWFVGGGIEARRAKLSGRASIIHRSSHIGDEFANATGAQRIEFGGEQLDLLAAWDLPLDARVHGGVSWIFRSYLHREPLLDALDIDDRGILWAGADRHWRPWQDRRLALWLGGDVQAAERTGWDPAVDVAAGMGLDSGRSLRLMLRYHYGPSPMGEFFLTHETFFGIELVAEI